MVMYYTHHKVKAAPVQDDVSQKLDALMKMVAELSGQMSDLSGQVEATEDCQRDMEDPLAA